MNILVGHEFHFPVFLYFSYFSEKLTSSAAEDESSPRKGIAVEAQLTSGKNKSTERSNCGFNVQLAIFLSCLFHQKLLSRCSEFKLSCFAQALFFFLFVGKLYIVPPFGTGLISSILIFPQALISGTGCIVSVCCIPFRSF